MRGEVSVQTHNFDFKFLINPNNIFLISVIDSSSMSLMYSRRFEIKNCVSNSDKEPKAMYRNLIYSFVEFLAAPSAMLEGIDSAALLICEIKPNFSSEGNLELNLYVETTKSIDFTQTFKSLCVLIYSIYLHLLLLLLSYILFI